jgi:flagellar basal-body rod protein FlgC
MDAVRAATDTAFSGLVAQSMRMRIIAENIANENSTGKTAGADPYRRKTLSFSNELDAISGASIVSVDELAFDPSPFRSEHLPGHPAADRNGNVKLPNVDMIIETADMKQTLRSYEANLQVIRQGREMMANLIDLLRSN